MGRARETALAIVTQGIRKKLETAFWELDDIVCAVAPDCPEEIQNAWGILYDLMSPEFIKKRDEVRGLNKGAAP